MTDERAPEESPTDEGRPVERTPGGGPSPADPARAARRKRIATWVLLALLVTVGLVSTLNRQQGEVAVYTRATRRALAGEEAYVVEAKAYTYPPAQLLAFLPIVAFPEQAERVLFYFVNVALLFGAVRLLSRLARAEFAERGRDGPGWPFWLVVVLLTARHLTSPLENQSNDLPILFLMAACASARAGGRDLLGGAAAATAAALKATPLLYGPILLWQRRWIAAAGSGAVLVGLTLLPDYVLPREDGARWIVVWYETFVSKVGVSEAAEAEGAWAAWNVLNQSLSGTIFRLSTDGGGQPWTWDVSVWAPSAQALKVATMTAQVAVLALVALAVGTPRAGREDAPDARMRRLGEASAVACAMLLLSPMSSKAHFCVLLLPAVYTATDWFTRRRDPLVAGLLVVALALGSLSSKGIVGLELGNGLLARGSVTWCTLAFLLAVARVAIARRRAFGVAAAAEGAPASTGSAGLAG